MSSRKQTKPAAPNRGAVTDEKSKALLSAIRQIWEAARTQVARSVNSALVQANWLIGKQIVEAEQGGKSRAAYGEQLLQLVSTSLSSEYGSGFSLSAIKYMRLFHLGYPDLIPIRHAVRDEFQNQERKHSSDKIRHALRDEVGVAP